jgi:hypothetical protein
MIRLRFLCVGPGYNLINYRVGCPLLLEVVLIGPCSPFYSIHAVKMYAVLFVWTLNCDFSSFPLLGCTNNPPACKPLSFG